MSRRATSSTRPPRHPDGIPPGHWDENQAPDGYQPRNPSLLERSRHWLRGPDDLAARNRQNVLIDGIGVGFAAGIGTFLSVFLVRLGASNFMVGLLTAMPALTGILLAFQVGAFLSRQRQVVPWFSRARLFVLSCYVLTGLVPYLFDQHVPEIIVGIWALATLPQTVVSVAFSVVMGQVAGPRGRVALMSQRWSTLGLANALAVLLAGQLLQHWDFPLNYQIIFLISAIGGLVSYSFSIRISLPDQEAPPAPSGRGSPWRQELGVLRQYPDFLRFTASQFIFRAGLSMAMPLLPLYWVRELKASDMTISFINTAQTVVLLVAYLLWTRLAKRTGERRVLLICAFGASFYPFLTALTHSTGPLAIYAGINGFFQAGVDLVFFDIMLDTCPPQNQARYIGLYQTTVFTAMFLAPLTGTRLADHFSLGWGLLIASALRLGGGVLLYLLGVGRGLKSEAAG